MSSLISGNCCVGGNKEEVIEISKNTGFVTRRGEGTRCYQKTFNSQMKESKCKEKFAVGNQ
jgi:hypothetical protein